MGSELNIVMSYQVRKVADASHVRALREAKGSSLETGILSGVASSSLGEVCGAIGIR